MFVIPMAGNSSRFYREGYSVPKFMLEAHGITLFEHSMLSFENYFDSDIFLFIAKEVKGVDIEHFINSSAIKLGIKNYKIVILNEVTRGQAETVAIGLIKGNVSDRNIVIFNIDTKRPFFKLPIYEGNPDGYLEVFEGEGDNWSFAKLGDDGECVTETAEKRAISNLCSTGLYYFSSSDKYIEYFNQYACLSPDLWEKGELYIAPLYNIYISNGARILVNIIERNDVIFFGVPSEYSEFMLDNTYKV
jgi:NDP-sugar pyrophosphorylase family protein